jgi:hypothetical protein
MSWWQRIFGFGKPQVSRDFTLYVQCQRCRTPVAVRIDRYNDISVEYDEALGRERFFLRKEIMDARCFQLMRAELFFDEHRRELSRSLTGGTFIDADTYQQLTQGHPTA